MGFQPTFTPEQRKAFAAKALETRRKRIAAEIAEDEAYRKRALELRHGIVELEKRIAELKMHEALSTESAKIDGRRLLREQEIVDASLPWDSACGIYFLIHDGRVVYVGQSVSVFSRISTHRQTKKFSHYAYVPCNEEHLNQLESLYIHLFEPELNGKNPHGYICAPISLSKLISQEK